MDSTNPAPYQRDGSMTSLHNIPPLYLFTPDPAPTPLPLAAAPAVPAAKTGKQAPVSRYRELFARQAEAKAVKAAEKTFWMVKAARDAAAAAARISPAKDVPVLGYGKGEGYGEYDVYGGQKVGAGLFTGAVYYGVPAADRTRVVCECCVALEEEQAEEEKDEGVYMWLARKGFTNQW
ncbi:hypothetical protein B0A55_05757 [Friedmanniomyces simplex]|uniref:Uncharacterized protein n=1 Tax=Friedmanniomyces simplex TaxID=329884 RepID=A0A4U0XEH2_9PEZI|nr:hypothetical protein B0A55_05757 [Friedmanniomyces simplex]